MYPILCQTLGKVEALDTLVRYPSPLETLCQRDNTPYNSAWCKARCRQSKRRLSSYENLSAITTIDYQLSTPSLAPDLMLAY